MTSRQSRKSRGILPGILAGALVCVFAAGMLFSAAAQIQNYESGGIIDMDGERFAPENPIEKAEWTFARFHYDLGEEFGFYRFQRWAADWPKADRQFILGVKRLTLIQSRSTEHVVDANGDDLFNYPWIYIEDAGAWNLSERQAARLREYLLRGGFLMIDDSHGDEEWQNFVWDADDLSESSDRGPC